MVEIEKLYINPFNQLRNVGGALFLCRQIGFPYHIIAVFAHLGGGN